MMKIGLLSNTTSEILAQRLSRVGHVWCPAGFNAWQASVLDGESALYREHPDIVLLMLDGHALLAPCATCEEGVGLLTQAVEAVRLLVERLPCALVLVSTLDIPQERIQPLAARRFERVWEYTWWSAVSGIIEQSAHVFFLDLKGIIERLGRANAYSPKMWYAGGIPYKMAVYEALEQEFLTIIQAWQGKRAKCLAVDFDETLWGGVAGEDGVEGIVLGDQQTGAAYRDFQLRLREIKSLGAVLVGVSKNNVADVEAIFNTHEQMVLHKEDFADWEVNWQEKPINLRAIAARLNIGMEAIVFIDDNPAEQVAMRKLEPDVIVEDFPHDRALLSSWAQQVYRKYFFCLRATQEDQQKTALYQANKARDGLRQQAGTVRDYLRNLAIHVRFNRSRACEIPRIAQLTQKTNQFNVTTKRYTEGDLQGMLKAPEQWLIYSIFASDRFGANGLVGVVMVCRNGMDAEIDTFLLSCRVMGRTIEETVLVLLENELRNSGVVEVRARYVPTSRNAPCARFYDDNGYALRQTEADGTRVYCLRLEGAPRVTKNVITVEV